MKTFKNFPAVLLKRLLLTFLLGCIFLIIGFVYLLYAKDHIFLFLSIMVFIGCSLRTYFLYRLIKKEDYITIEGICTVVGFSIINRYQQITLMNESGIETILKIAKGYKLRAGNRYRFYFKSINPINLDNRYIQIALATDQFLGVEDLGKN